MGNRRVLFAVRLALALAILTYVGFQLPWKDELTWTPGSGQAPLSVSGNILGDWRSSKIQFEVGSNQEINDQWPATVASGTLLTVSRSQSFDDDGYQWLPGMGRLFASLVPTAVLGGFAFLALSVVIAAIRWRRFLQIVNCEAGIVNTMRLSFIGMFFNLVVPGLTGGDAVRAIMLAREYPQIRVAAMTTVFVDRLFGLASLVVMALIAIALINTPLTEIATPLMLLTLFSSLGLVLYSSAKARGIMRLGRLLDRLSFAETIRSADRAILPIIRSPYELSLALALSFAGHIAAIMGIVLIGNGFGIDLAVIQYFVVVPIASLISTLPLTPGGWGLGEAAFHTLFEMINQPGSMGVAVSVTYRILLVALGMIGGLWLVVSNRKDTIK